MATAVRPPGYYTSWLHVVTEIKDTNLDKYKNGINLYNWIGDWTQANYGHRWTNASKKLNAILTINSGSIVYAPSFDTPISSTSTGFTNSPTPASRIPAILIPDDFRDFDRITIINNGIIIGQYGVRSYSGSGSFTPPQINSSSTVIVTDFISPATLSVAGGGGRGGENAGSGSGGGGGGGGAGGLSTKTVTVAPGVPVVASIGGEGQGSSYSQSGKVLVSAGGGGAGGNGFGGNRGRYCGGFNIAGICFNWFNTWADGEGGEGGRGGSPGGRDGQKGGSGGYRYDRSGMQRNSGGGSGGQGTGGNGGKGADEPKGNAGSGSRGWADWSYNRRELYGPAIVNFHDNVRIINNSVIAGGYAQRPVYAVYGTGLMEAPPTGIIIGGSFSGPPPNT